MYKFINKDGQVIEISGYDDFECVAKHDGQEIGKFVLNEWHDESLYLDHMDIRKEYQGCGIGKKMLELIVSVHGESIAAIYDDPELQGLGEDYPHLSIEGATFLNRCRACGILA